MEKGGTPKSRLTRSAAKQVNNTPSKKIEDEETSHKSIDEDTQHNSSRKSRRKTDSKLKTNGDASINSKKMLNYDSVTESNSIDGCESEDSNTSAKQRNSPKPSNHKTPSPTISRKSLRVRRSITPGPELESSASKKMKRCVSEGKLETVSTPTRRGGRAKSESKDFVFTPSKCKSNGKEIMGSISDSNKYIHRNSTLRVIDKIVEANEGEESSQDEGEKEKEAKQSSISPIREKVLNDSQTSSLQSKTEENISSPKPVRTKIEIETDDTETHCKNSNDDKNEGEIQSLTASPLELTKLSCRDPKENTEEPTIISEIANVPLLCHDNNLSTSEHKIQCEDKSSTVTPSPSKPDETITLKDEKLLQVDINTDSNRPLIDGEKTTGDKIECLNVSPSEDSKKNDASTEKTEEFSSDSQSDNVIISDNNNITLISEGIESKPVVKCKEATSDSKDINIVPESDEVSEDKNTFISEVKKSSSAPTIDDKEVTITDFEGVASVPTEFCVDKEDNVEVEPVVISESESPVSLESPEVDQCIGDPEEMNKSSNEEFNSRDRESCEIGGDDFKKTDEINDHNIIIPVANLEQREDNLVEVVIEDSENSQGVDEKHTSYLSDKIKDLETRDHQDDPSIFIEHENSMVIEYNMPSNPGMITKDPLEQDTSVLIQEASKLELLDEYGKEQFSENNENIMGVKVPDQYKLPGKNSTVRLDQEREFELEEDFDQDNYNNTKKKLEEDSGSNSDIYKDLSDFGTDGDEKKGGSNFDNSMSSEPGSGSVDSEEYASSGDYEEGEEEEDDDEEEDEEGEGKVEANEEQKNVPSINTTDVKNIKRSDQESDCKVGEKLFDTTTPMTYDKALAILNKNRVKKIDDEEFFDMFTQELNRVSEESGSDSDIAIVDEYIMEPEDTAKKPNQKTANPPSPQANVKPPQRPPLATNQPVPPLQHFPVNYSQQRPPQHIHPGMQSMNLPPSEMYNHYGNQGMPHANVIRGSNMYNQFAHHASNIADPQMYNHGPPDENYARGGMYNHPMGHVPDTQMHYANTPALKVRSVNTLNTPSFSNTMNQNYPCPEQMGQGLALEINALRNANEQEDSSRINREAMTGTANKLDQDSSQEHRIYKTGETPILDLLGLDSEKLKLLKKALGLRTKPLKTKMVSTKKYTNLGKKRQYTDIAKSRKREFKKSLLKKILSDSTFTGSFLKESDSSEHSTEESVSSDQVFPGSSNEKQLSNSSSSDTYLGYKKREVSIEDGSVSVTVFARKPRYRYLKKIGAYDQLAQQKSSAGNSVGCSRKKKRCQRGGKMSDGNSSSENLEHELNLKRKKMTQQKKQNKKESTVVKSNCGTFTVDPLTASSQSDSEALSHDEQLSEPLIDMEELIKRNMKKELASGKNKLSNMFSQHSFQQGRKGSKRKINEAFEEIDKNATKAKVRKLKRLPSEILEQLSNEGKKKRSHKQSGFLEEIKKTHTKPRHKNRAKSSKIKMANQDYIPFVTGGATHFALSRLDKTGTLTPAELAAQFRSEHLYGSTVKRITSKELMSIKEKQKKNPIASKKKGALRKEK